MWELIIKNGRIVDMDRVYEGTIAIQDGKIAALFESENLPEGKETIDASGKYVFPGIIDCHAHLNDPGFQWREDYRHGTAAAAIGGVTTIIDMPMQNEPALTDKDIFLNKEKAVASNALVDYCFWGGLVDYNFDKLAELDEAGVVAFKSFIGPVSPDYTSLNIGQARCALEIIKEMDNLAGFHCEDYSIIKVEESRAKAEGRNNRKDYLRARPVVAELIATQNIIELARETGARVHICHVSHPMVAETIKRAQNSGVSVTAETCPHYLVYTENDFLEKGSLYKCAPPLRSKEAKESLWKYVVDGTLSCVASDHSPCRADEKSEEDHGVFGAWGGISGIQGILQVMFDQAVNKRGYCPSLLSRCLAYGPAKTFGIYGQKGGIKAGFDADLVLVDPDQEWEITPEGLQYLNPISAFVGLKGRGLPVCTLVRGRIVAQNGNLESSYGFGRLVRKTKFLESRPYHI